MASRLRNFAVRRVGALGLGLLVFYLLLAYPYIVENDNAEFSTLSAAGGIAHPSGYPLYVLWLRAWSWLPASSPAHAAAIATAILAVVGMLVMHAACRAWGARPLAATIATGIVAAAPLMIRYNTTAEAFALNNTIVGCVLLLAATHGPLRALARAFALGLVAGLGLSNHLTCAIVAPVGILGVVRAGREARAVPAVAAAVVGLVVGLTPYLYFFAAPDHLASWPRPDGLGDVLAIFFRKDYGGAFGFSGRGLDVSWFANLAELGRTVSRSWLWGLAPLGVVTLARHSVRRGDGEARAGWIALAASTLLAGPLLTLRFDMPLDAIGLWTIRRFHLLPIFLLTLPIAVGIDDVARRLVAYSPFARIRPRLAQIGVALVVAAAAMASLPYVRRHHSPAFELEVRNTLRSLPPRAVIIAGIDELEVGGRYLQLARGERTDVTIIRWPTLFWDWYRAKVERAGVRYDPADPRPPRAQLVQRAHDDGRPVFVRRGNLDDLRIYPKYSFGVLVRVLPPGSATPPFEEVFELNRELFSKFELDYPFPEPADEWAAWMHYNYQDTWRGIGDVLARAGHPELAEEAHALARQFAPRNR